MAGFEFKPGREYRGIKRRAKPAPPAPEFSSATDAISAPPSTPAAPAAPPALSAPIPQPSALTSPPPAPSPPSPPTSTPTSPPQSTPPTEHFPGGYAFVVLHSNDEALVCYNTTYAPPDAHVNEDSGGVFTGEDGWWSHYEWSLMPTLFDHESPHLALCEVHEGEALVGNAMFGELTSAHLEAQEEPRTAYTMAEKVHKSIGFRVRQLRRMFDVVASIFRSAFTDKSQKLFETLDAQTQALLRKAVIPTEQALSMTQLWGGLRWYGIEHAADWKACWRAFHRAFSDTSAFVDMCAALLPAGLPFGDADQILGMLREQRQAQDQKPGVSRRGVILAGTDIRDYHAIYMRLNVPVYCLVLQSQLTVARELIRPAGSFRCSTKSCDASGNISERGLPSICYPPAGVGWVEFERIARGILARRREAALKTAELELANQKKRKRQELVAAMRQDKREQEFREAHPAMTISAEIYKAVAWYSPALRSYFDRQRKGKETQHRFAPSKLAAFVEGVRRAMETPQTAQHTGPRSMFFPTVEQFLSVNRLRLARMLTMFVWLLPTFHARVVLARTEPQQVRRWGTKDIKGILGGEHFVPSYIKNKYESFWSNPNEFWQHGGADLWGQEEAKRLKQPGALPQLGRLPCGHEATVDYIFKNDAVAESLLVSIGQLDALYSLVRMAKPTSLKQAGLPLVEEPRQAIYANGYDASRVAKKHVGKAGLANTAAADLSDMRKGRNAPDPFQHRTPSIAEFNRATSNTVLGLIRRIVMHKGFIAPSGWPTLWDAGTSMEKERRAWLFDFKIFLIQHAVYGEKIDEEMQKTSVHSWLSTNELRAKWHPPSLNAGKQSELEEHLFWRYSLTAMNCGLPPPAFYHEHHSGEPAKCALCNAPPTVPDGAYMDHDLDNEDEDWEYPRGWNEQ
ncbi:unnamed protein product [Peniophora sp. CBMAI 1063]|nr:unnamed protein product [Peniophora sp. CBMAI 1063]